jgi:hypothetical protein
LDSISVSLKKLTPEEQQLFAGYFMRHAIGAKMGGLFGLKAAPIPEGMTIGKAIDGQRAYLADETVREADEKALKEKVLKEREQAMVAMRSAVTVTLVSKKIATESVSGIETDILIRAARLSRPFPSLIEHAAVYDMNEALIQWVAAASRE